MLAKSLNQPSDSRKLPRFRFSLLALFAVTFLAAVLIVGWRNWYIHSYIPRQPIPWRDFQPGLLEQRNGKRLLIHFTADWNPTSKSQLVLMETPEVRSAIYKHGYFPVLVDCTYPTQAVRDLMKSCGISLVPGTVVDSGSGPQVLPNQIEQIREALITAE